MKIVLNGDTVVGGGTSQSAPIWAGLTAVMTQYLMANGGSAIGDINPLLYRIAQGAPLPAFRDVTLGGNAVDTAGPGYDLVSGLGTPDVDNLVRNLLTSFQRKSSAMSTETDETTETDRTDDPPGMVECRVCEIDVPEGEFCGLCGIPLTEHGSEGPGVAADRAPTAPRPASIC